MKQETNLNVTNKLRIPKNVNLKKINGQSLVSLLECPENILIPYPTSNVLIDGGTFAAPTNSVIIDAGSF